MLRVKIKDPEKLKYDIGLTGLSQGEYASEVKISGSQLSQVLTGKLDPTNKMLQKITGGINKNWRDYI